MAAAARRSYCSHVHAGAQRRPPTLTDGTTSMNQSPRDKPTLAYIMLIGGLGLFLLTLVCAAIINLFHIGGR
jgi:hypothetical protein